MTKLKELWQILRGPSGELARLRREADELREDLKANESSASKYAQLLEAVAGGPSESCQPADHAEWVGVARRHRRAFDLWVDHECGSSEKELAAFKAAVFEGLGFQTTDPRGEIRRIRQELVQERSVTDERVKQLEREVARLNTVLRTAGTRAREAAALLSPPEAP